MGNYNHKYDEGILIYILKLIIEAMKSIDRCNLHPIFIEFHQFINTYMQKKRQSIKYIFIPNIAQVAVNGILNPTSHSDCYITVI